MQHCHIRAITQTQHLSEQTSAETIESLQSSARMEKLRGMRIEDNSQGRKTLTCGLLSMLQDMGSGRGALAICCFLSSSQNKVCKVSRGL
mmetsp:Transcript_101396/g.160331  ORF Transcript_101396/g.160331 Transcript_101396/m.160331 type:complete len:90 (-) Transcript_101396:476-745(-)